MQAWDSGVRAIFIVGMSYCVVMGIVQPFCNWDMLGYVGSVISWSEPTHEGIYAKTMATIRDHVRKEWFEQYLSNPLSAESDAFAQQLPLYNVKPLYTGLMWLAHQCGADLPVASWIVSSLSIALLSATVLLWKPVYESYALWLLSVLALAFLFPFPMGTLAQSSSPDALCAFLVTAMFFSWLYRQSFTGFAACAMLAQLARPDALLMSVTFALYFAFLSPASTLMPKVASVALCAALAASYGLVSYLGHNYGLERWFIYAFVDKTPYPGEMTGHLTLAKYWEILAPSTQLFLNNPRTRMMLGWSAAAIVFYFLKPACNRQNLHILLISWAVLAVRFLLFPGWGEDRYYFVYFIIMLYAGGEMMSPYVAAAFRLLGAAHRKILAEER